MTTRPSVRAEFRARHERKPPGTIGAEVWLALTATGQPAPPLNIGGGTGVPPVSGEPTLYRFLSVSSRGNLQADFPSADAGKTAYYALRWVSTRGEKGPWSEVCGTEKGAQLILDALLSSGSAFGKTGSSFGGSSNR